MITTNTLLITKTKTEIKSNLKSFLNCTNSLLAIKISN